MGAVCFLVFAARLTAQASGGRRQNINREGCVSDENDFASVRLNDAADSPSGSGKGNDGNQLEWRLANETINKYLFQIRNKIRTFLIANLIRLGS